MPRRATRADSRKSFDAYRSALSGGGAPQPRRMAATIVVATCSGCERLAQAAGRPLHLVTVSQRPSATIEELRSHRYGGYVVDADGSPPFILEEGWDDWRTVPMTNVMTSGREFPPGVALRTQALHVTLPTTTTAGAFKRRLNRAIAHIGLETALRDAAAIGWRHARDLPLDVASRYARSDPSTFQHVDDIYVFDPWSDLQALAVRACAAAMADPPEATNG